MKTTPRDFIQCKNGSYIANNGSMDYQKLFNYMAEEHGIPLFVHEMEEIVRIVLEMNNETPEKHTKKTAVQFFESELRKLAFDKNHHLELGDIRITQGMIDELSQRMQEMEKEQIMNAYKEGCSDSILDESTDEIRAEEYYNETYRDKK